MGGVSGTSVIACEVVQQFLYIQHNHNERKKKKIKRIDCIVAEKPLKLDGSVWTLAYVV